MKLTISNVNFLTTGLFPDCHCQIQPIAGHLCTLLGQGRGFLNRVFADLGKGLKEVAEQPGHFFCAAGCFAYFACCVCALESRPYVGDE